MLFRRLNIGNWSCSFYFAVNSYWNKEILRELVSLDAPPSIIHQIHQKMLRDELDSGFTYSNMRLRRSVLVVGRSSSGKEFLNSFCHELRHLVDDISRIWGLSLSGEPVAYLTGDIALELSDIVCKMSCDHCRY